MSTLEKIKSIDDRLKKIKSTISDNHSGKLSHKQIESTLIPNLRFIDQIGATSLFHKALESLGEDFNDNIEIQICKMLDCYEAFDYIGMAFWLQHIRNHQNLTLEQRAVVAINTIFANSNGGCFDDYVDSAISDLERLIYEDNYFTREGVENLMQELEAKDKERLQKYVLFLENFNCRNWEEFNWVTYTLYYHYRRSNDFSKQHLILKRFSSGTKKFDLTETERLIAEIQFLRLLFECRDGSWENYSISLFTNHKVYLNSDIEVAFTFIREFYSIIKDGEVVYGRYLNEKCILDVSKEINTVLKSFFHENKNVMMAFSLSS